MELPSAAVLDEVHSNPGLRDWLLGQSVKRIKTLQDELEQWQDLKKKLVARGTAKTVSTSYSWKSKKSVFTNATTSTTSTISSTNCTTSSYKNQVPLKTRGKGRGRGGGGSGRGSGGRGRGTGAVAKAAEPKKTKPAHSLTTQEIPIGEPTALNRLSNKPKSRARGKQRARTKPTKFKASKAVVQPPSAFEMQQLKKKRQTTEAKAAKTQEPSKAPKATSRTVQKIGLGMIGMPGMTPSTGPRTTGFGKAKAKSNLPSKTQNTPPKPTVAAAAAEKTHKPKKPPPPMPELPSLPSLPGDPPPQPELPSLPGDPPAMPELPLLPGETASTPKADPLAALRSKNRKSPQKSPKNHTAQTNSSINPACSTCGCTEFKLNPFKKGNCNNCFHNHV